MLNIIGKIDLAQFERKKKPEISSEKFDRFLASYAEGVNKEFGHFLNTDTSIDSSAVGYDQAEAAMLSGMLEDKERMWAKDQGKDLRTWRADREKNSDNVAEKAITSLMAKFFGERFVMARAAKFDDYENGVDNVLIDKQTGAVVCGLDDVLRKGSDKGESKKAEKMVGIYRRQGMNMKYGATINKGQLQRRSFKNLPAFYVSIDEDDLGKICQDFSEGNNFSEIEKRTMEKVMQSLSEQYHNLSPDDYHPNLAANLEAFRSSLSAMRNILDSKK